jgi:hypothetical protein
MTCARMDLVLAQFWRSHTCAEIKMRLRKKTGANRRASIFSQRRISGASAQKTHPCERQAWDAALDPLVTISGPCPAGHIHRTEPAHEWPALKMKRGNFRNLLRRPARPAAGRGRLQVQLRRAFAVHGGILSSTVAYDFCYARHRARGERIGRGHRWSVIRLLRAVADPIGRAGGSARPILWRLKPKPDGE